MAIDVIEASRGSYQFGRDGALTAEWLVEHLALNCQNLVWTDAFDSCRDEIQIGAAQFDVINGLLVTVADKQCKMFTTAIPTDKANVFRSKMLRLANQMKAIEMMDAGWITTKVTLFDDGTEAWKWESPDGEREYFGIGPWNGDPVLPANFLVE